MYLAVALAIVIPFKLLYFIDKADEIRFSYYKPFFKVYIYICDRKLLRNIFLKLHVHCTSGLNNELSFMCSTDPVPAEPSVHV